MKKIKIMLMLVTSLGLVSCSSFESPKEVVSVEYSEGNKYQETTFKDGTTRVKNLEFAKQREEVKQNREDQLDLVS